jgi:hypothetical protein
VQRSDKKIFKTQIVLKKTGMFEKRVPTWASDFKLLEAVVEVQTMRAKAWQSHASSHPNWSSSASQPSTFGLFGSESKAARKARLEKESVAVFKQLKTIQEIVLRKKAQEQARKN